MEKCLEELCSPVGVSLDDGGQVSVVSQEGHVELINVNFTVLPGSVVAGGEDGLLGLPGDDDKLVVAISLEVNTGGAHLGWVGGVDLVRGRVQLASHLTCGGCGYP